MHHASGMHDFQRLQVWTKARELAVGKETVKHLLIACDLDYITPVARDKHLDALGSERMLVGLMKKRSIADPTADAR
jgi:hypothetical protein